MLIHLASYPRSGNSLVQQVIHDYFGRPTSTIFDLKPAKVERYINIEVPSIRNWRKPSARPSLIGGILSRFDPLPDWLASFDLTLPSGEVILQKYLMPGCPEILTPSNRKKLARMDSTFFIKTHRRPYDAYFEGEFIILPVRHPGAVLNSLKHFMKDHRGKDVPLDDVIAGKTPHGSWSEWHSRWLAIHAQYPSQMLILRFEETLADPRAAAERISDFLQVPYDEEAHLKDFEKLQQTAPKHFRSGKADAWKQAYTLDQEALVEELHSPTMSRLNRIAESSGVTSDVTKKIAKLSGLLPLGEIAKWLEDGGDSFLSEADFWALDDCSSFLAFIVWAYLLVFSSRSVWLWANPFSSRLRLQRVGAG